MFQDFSIPENHIDLEILCKHTNTDPRDIGPSSYCGTNGSGNCNYMRVYDFDYWNESSISELKSQIQKANQLTTEYSFELKSVDDYEVEFDNDRSWPASFTFKSIKK